ncbi:MAG: hypothetical protein ABEK00_03780 [Candidatus Nanohaloarchaea archaeon]
MSPANPVQTDQYSPSYQVSMQESWEITQSQYALRSLQTLANISKNRELTGFESAMADLVLKGTYNGTSEQKVSLDYWEREVLALSSPMKSISASSINFSISYFNLTTTSKIRLSTKRRAISYIASDKIEVKGVSDPLISELGYSVDIEPCNYNRLATEAYDGGAKNGTARGYPLVEPADPASELSPETHILITRDITQFDNSTTQDFAGYASVQVPGSPSEYNDDYIVGIPSIPSFEQGQTAIIFEGLWKANFARTMERGCYLPSSLQNTPGIRERLKKEAVGSTNQGVYTVLNVSDTDETPAESNIGYERINASNRELIMIEGVSRGEGIVWPHFRISREIAIEAGAQGLAE